MMHFPITGYKSITICLLLSFSCIKDYAQIQTSIAFQNINFKNSKSKHLDSLYIDLKNDSIFISYTREIIIDSFPGVEIKEDSFQMSYLSSPPLMDGPFKIKKTKHGLSYFILGENGWKEGGIFPIKELTRQPSSYFFSSQLNAVDDSYFSEYKGDTSINLNGGRYKCFIIRQFDTGALGTYRWLLPEVILYISKKYLLPFKIIVGSGSGRKIYEAKSISWGPG